MSYIVVDIESDNQSPATGSMVCFGAVLVSDTTKTFYGETKPVMKDWNPEALAISGFSREQHEGFDDPKDVMQKFADWVEKVSDGKPTFISDNPAFDWQWINYYFHKYLGRNPFGFAPYYTLNKYKNGRRKCI
jgi:DNA polymerase III epsilon subunit-like protein